MRLLLLLGFLSLTGCVYERTIAPELMADTVNEAWVNKVCGNIPMADRDPCTGRLKTVSPGICSYDANSALVRKNGQLWCGIAQHIDDKNYHMNMTLIYVNGEVKTIPHGQRFGWDAEDLALLGVVALSYAANQSDNSNTQGGYEFSGTESMNSLELGSELLNQKNSKGIRGKGRVVTALPTYKVGDDPGKPLPGTVTPSIGYNPQDSAKQNRQGQPIGYDSAFTVVPMLDAGLTCIYTNGDKAVAFMKSNGCPSSVKWPNEYSNEIFDMTQGGKVATNGVSRRLSISNSNSTNCAYYIQPDTYVSVPKGRGASCPSRMNL